MNGAMRTYQSLLFGNSRRLMQSIPGMLVRAGFELDVIARRHSRCADTQVAA